MEIFLTNQNHRFPKHLEVLKKASVMDYDRSLLKEKVTRFPLMITEMPDPEPLFDYQIFPERIISAFSEWKHGNRPMQVGDTIIQQAFLPPLKSCSLKMIFGVRICEIIREENKIGFSYETLKGHVECGISTFVLERINGRIFFSIHTFSKPGNFLSRLFSFVFTLPYQAYCTRAAGKNVQNHLKIL